MIYVKEDVSELGGNDWDTTNASRDLEIDSSITDDDDADEVDKNNVLRICIVSLAITLGTIIKDYAVLVALAGAIFMAFAGVILPALIYIMAMRQANRQISPMRQMLLAYTLGFG
eukprot:CAMPEP_0116047578 /NCGR_PEP_ID=MMETSP0321-20121206/28987_1 /TAXON_ID=163516 /ORGANISM="Leptocylindrus danicus var. danicus, Strain B650" /LENGTH=114 /DNA_ID=CAMNT_0003529509 /DNA_START=326 /DNA_END=666 /DNA_ORIENTATION=+